MNRHKSFIKGALTGALIMLFAVIDAGKFKLKVKIPCNTTAVVKMPDGRLYKVGSGMYQFE